MSTETDIAKRRHWKPADDEILRAMILADRTYVEIGEALSRSPAAVKSRRQFLRCPFSAEAARRARSATATALAADPVYRAKQINGCKRGWRNADERREKARQKALQRDAMGHCQRAVKADPEKAAAKLAQSRRQQRIITAKRVAWCPADRREEYRKLMERIGAAEARRQIESTMTAFERTLAKARAGEIRLVERTYAPASSGSFDVMTESRA